MDTTVHLTESKHYTVDLMCILHLLYFLPDLLITKSENTLDTFSNMIRRFLENVGRCNIRQKKGGLSERTNWCLQVATHFSKVCTVPKSFQCNFMSMFYVIVEEESSTTTFFCSSPSCAVEELDQAHL